MSRPEYVGHPELVQAREGFSLLDLKRYMQNYCGAHYKGEGLGQLEFGDFLERAPLMVPVNALGYKFRRISGRNGEPRSTCGPRLGEPDYDDRQVPADVA
jgi:hypothetical protein